MLRQKRLIQPCVRLAAQVRRGLKPIATVRSTGLDFVRLAAQVRRGLKLFRCNPVKPENRSPRRSGEGWIETSVKTSEPPQAEVRLAAQVRRGLKRFLFRPGLATQVRLAAQVRRGLKQAGC